jgi:hypothetical protein
VASPHDDTLCIVLRHLYIWRSRGTRLNGFLDIHQTQIGFARRPSADAEEYGKPQPA